MQKNILVYLGDTAIEVGTLWFESLSGREHSSFQYAQSWLEHPLRFAVSPSIPLDSERRFFRVNDGGRTPLPLPIADSTPDSWGRSIVRKDASKSGGAPLNELDFLLTVDDFSRMGALRFREQHDSPFLASEVYKIPPLLEIDQVGRDIAEMESGDPAVTALRRLRQVGTVFGGARPKCSVIDTDGQLAIAKFTSRLDTYAVERAEVMTLNLARFCGINTPEARIQMSDSLPVAIIRRFDRGIKGRIPFISAQTFLDSPSATGRTYVELADALRQHGEQPRVEMRKLFDRIAFTILVSNVDDHLKNHGFVYAKNDKWKLSPAFDINPAPERFKELKTAIADPAEPDASLSLLLDHAFYFEIDKDRAVETVANMAKTVSEKWQGLAKQAGMNKREIGEYTPAFEHKEMRFALKHGGEPFVKTGKKVCDDFKP